MSGRRNHKRPPRDYSDAPYEVGKGKTPVGARFAPGVSGNPKGRPRKTGMSKLDFGREIYQSLQEKVTARKDGKVIQMTITQAILQQQINKALAGDTKAANWLLAKAEEAAPHVRQAITTIILDTLEVPKHVRESGLRSSEADDWDEGGDVSLRGTRPTPFASLVVDNGDNGLVEYRLYESGLFGDLWGDDTAIAKAEKSKNVMLVPRDREETIDIRISNRIPGGEARFRVIPS